MKVCRVCLAMSVKMYHMSKHKLSVVYELVTGVEINTEDKLPKMLCWECVARLSSANSFIKKALKTNLILVDKLKSSRFLSMGDIESIDKSQLKSTLGVKVYRENFSNLHIIKERDNIDQHFNNEEEQIFVTDVSVEKDPIKIEYVDKTEEQKFENEDLYNKRNEIKFLSIDFKVEPDEVIKNEHVSDYEGYDGSDHFEEHKHVVDVNDVDVSSNCKEVKVVVEDVLTRPIEHSTQDSFKYLTEDPSTEDDKKNILHRPINQKILFKDEDNRFEVPKYIDIICDNPNIGYQEGTSQKVRMKTPSNIATSSKTTIISDKPSTPNRTRRRTNKNQNIDYNCKQCTYETTFRSRLKYHMITKHPKSTYSCAHCDFGTTIKASLIGHINAKHTKNIIFKCSYCAYKTHIKANLNAHVNTKHTKNNIFNCSYCNYKTTVKPNLITHINNKHTKVDIFKCSFCNYKVYNKLSLNRHVNAKHTKTKVFDCPYCSFKSYRRCHLNTHVTAKHNESM